MNVFVVNTDGTGLVRLNPPGITSGLIDSFDVAALASFIEKECNIRIEPEDLVLENVNCIEAILRFAAGRASDRNAKG